MRRSGSGVRRLTFLPQGFAKGNGALVFSPEARRSVSAYRGGRRYRRTLGSAAARRSSALADECEQRKREEREEGCKAHRQRLRRWAEAGFAKVLSDAEEDLATRALPSRGAPGGGAATR